MDTTVPGMWMWAFVLVLATIIVVVVLWQGMKTGRTAIRTENNGAYKKLAEEVLAAEQRLLGLQERTAAALDDIRVRMASVEKLLKEVG